MKWLILVLPLLGCAKVETRDAATGSGADSSAVNEAVAQYRNAWIKGDTAAALNRISKDIRIFISGVPDVVGFDAARKLFLDEMTKYEVPRLDLFRQELILSGDHAIDIGTFEEIQIPKTGRVVPIRGRGRYLTIWRREGNDWRIVRYMLNELPAP